MYILGISCFYHESAACLLQDGKIIAASAQERFSRIKHDYVFPTNAIQFCIDSAKIGTKDIDYVVFYEKPFLKFERNLIISLRHFPKSYSFFVDSMKNSFTEKLWIKSIIAQKLNMNPDKILFVPHHLSHAAASFYPSPFDEAAYLTLDGVGEWTTGSWGIGSGNKLYPQAEMRFPHSVGLLYSTFTAFLGFEVNDGEYKVMGMAGYGKPIHVGKIKKLYKQSRDGSITLHLDYFAFHYSSKKMYSHEFEKLFAGLDKFDIAASLQISTEEIILNLLSYLYEKTKQKYLVYGGGVGLNSVLNGKIPEKTKFKDVFIFPAAGDDGGSVGAALYVYHHVLNNKKRVPLLDVSLGASYTNTEIETFLKKKNIQAKKMNEQKRIRYIAESLSEGKVIGWFQGKAEFGPRALGHRSILADPRMKEMKDIVNQKIKFREEFRPFAPVILEEHANEYFDITSSTLSKYMLGTFRAKQRAIKAAPAVVHVDKTSRVQTLQKEEKNGYRRLLEEFYRQTGVPMLLNTSFNLKGEPIVNSPKDAYRTFLRSGLDILVIENYIVEKV